MIAIIFGRPGSGKGTQSSFLAQHLKTPHISTGAMLRREAESGSTLGLEIEPIIDTGSLVSDELMLQVLEERLRQDDANRGMLLDGFPRTVNQAKALDKILSEQGKKVTLVIVLDVSKEVVLQRIADRSLKDDRADDHWEVTNRRMLEYDTKTVPVLDYYRQQGAKVYVVDGSFPAAAVSSEIEKAVSSIDNLPPTA